MTAGAIVLAALRLALHPGSRGGRCPFYRVIHLETPDIGPGMWGKGTGGMG